MADQQTERYQARQQHQRIVLWGCDIHRTPRGRNAGAAPTRANYSPAPPSEEHWPAWPGSPRRPASPARSQSSRSAGPWTSSSVTPWSTSPATLDCPTPGPPTSTSARTREHANTRTRGHDHPHAVRVLARAWLYIIWRCAMSLGPHDLPPAQNLVAPLWERLAH
jgi:hypothetical protein